VRRIDLPEIADRTWCPRWVREALVGYLNAVITVTRPYDMVAPYVAHLLRQSAIDQIVDLASGSGGPWPALRDALIAHGVAPRVTLTDRHPNLSAVQRLHQLSGLRYDTASRSAVSIPSGARAMRTMFTALHHFTPKEIQAILGVCQAEQVPFLAAEATERSWRGIMATIVIPLLVVLFMARVRPRRLLPTYMLPILPFLIWWDGLASTLSPICEKSCSKSCRRILRCTRGESLSYVHRGLSFLSRSSSGSREPWPRIRNSSVPGEPHARGPQHGMPASGKGSVVRIPRHRFDCRWSCAAPNCATTAFWSTLHAADCGVVRLTLSTADSSATECPRRQPTSARPLFIQTWLEPAALTA
jgi:hypothetical protein